MFNSNASSANGAVNYIEDVFSTYLYTGTGSAITITNDIDLSTKGGLVWIKDRNNANGHFLTDTARGTNSQLRTASAAAATTSTNYVTSFGSNGFAIGTNGNINTSGNTEVAWTFRKQPKFFDVVTYTGTGAAKTINHSLGSTPGCIIVKRTDSSTSGDWFVYHRSMGNTKGILLNGAGAEYADIFYWNNTSPTSTNFTVGYGPSESGGTYVAYLFAHDAGGFGLTGTDNVISCGSYTGASSNPDQLGNLVNLGWEPQFVLIKATQTGAFGDQPWLIYDNMRGMVVGGNESYLQPNSSAAEVSGNNYFEPESTGFRPKGGARTNEQGYNYIYIAIRRGPMKVPTDGAKVFAPVARTGTGADANITNGFVTDLVISQARGNVGSDPSTFDRLRGATIRLRPDSIGAELTATDSLTSFASMTGVTVGADSSTQSINWSGTGGTYVTWSFQRAPSFFDEVCYTGNATARTINHNLGVVPELMIVKRRTNNDGLNVGYWVTYAASQGNTKFLYLNTTDAAATNTLFWDSTSPTSTVFTVGTQIRVNGSGEDYVAYLFATCAGVSKVGSYTGNGTTQQINCGFAAGARFVMIKRTDSTGDWYVWDSARGIVAGNDPYLLLNSTAAEVTSTDYVDTYAAGFELTSTAPAAINASGGSYIFLAIA